MAISSKLKVNGEHRWDSVMAIAKIGPGTAGGYSRQSLTDDGLLGRQLFARGCDHAGCTMDIQ